jgi:hypothetical protein
MAEYCYVSTQILCSSSCSFVLSYRNTVLSQCSPVLLTLLYFAYIDGIIPSHGVVICVLYT